MANLYWRFYQRFINRDIPRGGVDVFGCTERSPSQSSYFLKRILALSHSCTGSDIGASMCSIGVTPATQEPVPGRFGESSACCSTEADNPPLVVSCPTTTACVGVGLVFEGAARQFGAALSQSTSFNGAGWSPPTVVDPGGFVGDLSCASATFCVQSEMDGTVGTFDGSAWSDPIQSWTTRRTAVSCRSMPAASFCLAWSQYNATVYLGTA